MRYALLIYTDETAAISPEERSRRAAAFTAFQDQAGAQGVLLAVEQLQPAETATTVRAWDGGDVMIGHGPSPQAKEQLAGVLIVDCKDPGEATEVALRVPAAWYGTVEVRPVAET